MISVSDGFKTAIKKGGRQIKGYINDAGSYVTESDDLQTIKITASGSLCKSIMRTADCTFIGDHSYLNKYINLGIGVVIADGSTEYLDYGSFKVLTQTTNQGNSSTEITLNDKMYEALQPYALQAGKDIIYPTTLLGLLQAVCSKLEYTFDVTTFPNQDNAIPGELFLNQQLSYRDVLDQIAEAAGSIIYFGNNDHLKMRQVTNTVSETLTPTNLNSLKVETIYGPVTSLVLSREPQEDNIVEMIS